MSLNFPSTPADQQVYDNYIYDATKGVWNKIPDSFNTDEVSEGTVNLYFTNQRAIDAVVDNIELDELSDVATAGVADGDALVYDTATTSWVPGSVAIDSLNDIADVNITDPANGEVLVYSDGDWVNQEASGGGIKDIRTSTTGFTFAIEDAGDMIQVDSSSSTTITIPTNVSVAIPVKTQVNIVRAGTGDVVIEASVGVTANSTPGLKLRDQWSVATAIKTGEDEWLITGDLSE